MAEISVGDVVARLVLNTTEWQRNLQAATQSLQQFQAAMQQQSGGMQQSTTRASQAFQQLTQQLTLLNQQAISQTGFMGQMAAGLDRLEESLRRTGTAAQQSGQQAQQSAQVWQGMLQIAGGIGIATSVQGIVAAMTDFARSVITVGMQMQTLRASFLAITGDARAAQQAFAFVTQTSSATGQSLTTLAQSYRTLSAATRGTALEGQDTQRLLVALAQAARAYGLSNEQLQRVLVGFQQTISKTKVEQEELRQQIGEAFPNALQIMARGLGTTTEGFNQLVARGMESTQLVRSFTRQLEQELPKGTQQVETAAQAFNRLGNEILLLKDKIAQSGYLEFLAKAAGGVADVMEAQRRAEEQQRQFIDTTARERFGGREVRPQDFEAMKGLVAQADQLRMSIEGAYKLLETGNVIQRNVAENQLRPLLAQYDAVQRQLMALQAGGPERFRVQQGVQARMDLAGDDRLRVEQERERDVQAGEARIRTILERQRGQLAQIDLKSPFLTELERAEERLKIITETTKQLKDLLQTLPPAVQIPAAAPGATRQPYQELIERLAVERGIDPNLAMALVAQESGFNPRARSQAGAMGLMQLMPGTAAEAGLRGGSAEQQRLLQGVFEPEANLKAGLDYLAKLLTQFSGDVSRALTAYNAGPRGGGIPQATGENARFAEQVLARIPGGATGSMAAQMRLQEAAQAAVEQQEPDREAIARIHRIGQEDLRRIDEQMRAEQQLGRTIEQMKRFIGQADQEQAQQAAQRIRDQGADYTKMLKDAQQLVAQSPPLRILRPEAQAEIAQLLAQLPAVVEQRAQEALQRVEAQTRQTARRIEQDMAEALTLAGRTGMSAPEQARLRAQQDAEEKILRLRQAQEQIRLSPDLQAQDPTREARLQAIIQTTQEALPQIGQMAFDRMDATMRQRIQGMGDQVEQVRLKLSAAGLSPLEQDLVNIRREFERMLDVLDKAQGELEKELPTATQDRADDIAQLLYQIQQERAKVAPGLEQALQARTMEPENRAIEELKRLQEQSRTAILGPATLLGDPRLELQLQQMRRDKEGQERIQTPQGLADQEALENQIRSFQRLNYAAGLFQEVAGGVGNAWTQALLSIANHTQSVGEAFRAMGQSIMQTLIQITSQETWRMFVQLGLRLVGGALTAGATGGMGAGIGADAAAGPAGAYAASAETSSLASSIFAGISSYQHGGYVATPQLAMIGDAPGGEFVVPHRQMQDLMGARQQQTTVTSPSVILVDDRAAAERAAMAEQAAGREAIIISTVLKNLSTGEGSSINRAIRTLQR